MKGPGEILNPMIQRAASRSKMSSIYIIETLMKESEMLDLEGIYQRHP